MKRKLLLSLILVFAIRVIGLGQTAEMPSTETVMKAAYAQAAKENKKVMVIFHASWCGWCKKMEASINEPTLNKLFTDNYVIAYLDVLENKGKENLENAGSKEYMAKYQGEKSGLPFWFIADAKGKKLADSQVRPEGAALDTYGKSVGCPADPEEVTFFIQVLKTTSKLNDGQLAMISERFAKNKPAPVVKPAATPKPVTTSK
ncbi:MAG: thioredoxin family protein [Bacteroidota bacterium]